jgi:hypothetical protein
MFFISYFRSLGFNLTNQTDGGYGARGYKRSEEWKAAASARQKGRQAPWAGQHMKSPEQRAAVSARFKGKKLSEAHANLCRMAAPRRAIVDNQGVEYPSVREAARAIGVDRAAIQRVLAGKQKTSLGRTFHYKEEQ